MRLVLMVVDFSNNEGKSEWSDLASKVLHACHRFSI